MTEADKGKHIKYNFFAFVVFGVEYTVGYFLSLPLFSTHDF